MATKLLLVSNILNRKHVRQIILHRNPTILHLYMLKPLYLHETPLQVSALNGPSSGSTDTCREPGWQNTCPDVLGSKNYLHVNYTDCKYKYNLRDVYTYNLKQLNISVIY
jgi:hypothetical protein